MRTSIAIRHLRYKSRLENLILDRHLCTRLPWKTGLLHYVW